MRLFGVDPSWSMAGKLMQVAAGDISHHMTFPEHAHHTCTSVLTPFHSLCAREQLSSGLSAWPLSYPSGVQSQLQTLAVTLAGVQGLPGPNGCCPTASTQHRERFSGSFCE